MEKLIFKRRKIPFANSNCQNYRLRVDANEYNKVVEIADESGETLKNVVSKMINFAYENIAFESEDK